MITDEQAEDIVVMSKLCGITETEAAVRLGHMSTGSSRYPNDLSSWENTLKILQARKRLENLTKKAQS